jgi:Fe2+ or Zn2+ uptake regulation protein
MTTVNYTLDMLKREGLIRELEFYDRDNRYDVNVEEHINFICRKCGRSSPIFPVKAGRLGITREPHPCRIFW